jgi:hypothetical protein
MNCTRGELIAVKYLDTEYIVFKHLHNMVHLRLCKYYIVNVHNLRRIFGSIVVESQ